MKSGYPSITIILLFQIFITFENLLCQTKMLSTQKRTILPINISRETNVLKNERYYYSRKKQQSLLEKTQPIETI